MLIWQDAMHDDEPRDQNADTALFAHGYWSLGPAASGRWSVTLVEQDASLDETGATSWDFATEAQAKEYAALVESGEIPLEI